LEELCSTLYFSCQIKYLNLREIKTDTKENVLHQFNILMRQLSRTVFYTISGAIEPSSLSGRSMLPLNLSREVSFSEFSEGNLQSMNRLRSRPFVPCEDEQLDFINKKLKFE
jgi:hypothetical protein